MRAWRVLPIGLTVYMMVVGCAKPLSPISPGHAFVPEKHEMRLWEESRRWSDGLLASGAVYRNEELERYLGSVLHRMLGSNLSEYAPLKPRVFILDAESTNAFALSHGDIFVHTGILGRLRNEAQLAMLLGHEITHATHRHMYQEREQLYAQSGANAYISVLSALGGQNLQNALSRLGTMMTLASVSGYSRRKEAEADRVGLMMMARAGYDPHEGAMMFQRMLEATDKRDRRRNFFYAKHPAMKKRVASCRKLLETLPPAIAQHEETGQDRYLAHTADLIYQEARTHIACGKFDLALETLQFMRQARPQDGRAPALLGDLLRARCKADDPRRAREAYQEALTLDKTSRTALRGLGLMCLKDGDNEDAVKLLEQYLSVATDATDAPYIRQSLQKLKEEP